MGSEQHLIGDLAAVGEHSLARGRALLAILIGTLVAGTLDISAAILTWLFRGVPAIRVLQSVAGGLLGRATFNGGAATASLGLLLHFLIMSVIVATFVVASHRLAALVRHPIACGIAYGLIVYCVMTFVVVPLSASGAAAPSVSANVQGAIVHIVCVGVPIALIARRFA